MIWTEIFTQDGLWVYEWDAENRLIAMESRSDLPASVTRQRLEFAYDSRNRRIAKTMKEYDSGSSSWTITAQIKFLYDGWNLIAEYDALNSDALIRSHAWGLDLSGTPQGAGGVGGLLWSSESGADYAPGYDANGNIIAWVNLSDGSLAGTAEYGAFGETLTLNGISAEMPFGFSTKYEDSETSLLYYGFRYYDPVTGRWPNRDPIGERGGLNLYGMVGNDVVNYVDYLGLALTDGFMTDDLLQAQIDALCSVAATAIRTQFNTDKEREAWDNYTSGSGSDIALTSNEWEAIITSNVDFNDEISKLESDCGSSSSGWLDRTKNIGGTAGSPWAFAIGRYSATLEHSCKSSCLEWSVELEDPYDFNPEWFDTSRELENELKTIGVAGLSNLCSAWKTFNFTGTYTDTSQSN